MNIKYQKKMLIISFLIFSFFIILGCSNRTKENFNLKVINNSNKNLKSISYHTKNSSHSGTIAGNNFIENGDSIKFNVETNIFYIKIIDENDNSFVSPEYDIKFENENLPIVISLEESNSGKWSFIKK